jgi:hypothetical protein
LFRNIPFAVMNASGARTVTIVSAVRVRISDQRAAIMFVDNAEKKIYGQVYFSGTGLDDKIGRLVKEVDQDLQASYRDETGRSLGKGMALPSAGTMKERIGTIVAKHVAAAEEAEQDKRSEEPAAVTTLTDT